MFPVIQWKDANVLARASGKFGIQESVAVGRPEPGVHWIITGQQGFLGAASIERFPEHAVLSIPIAAVRDVLSVGGPRRIPVLDPRSEARLGVAGDVVHPGISDRPFDGGRNEAAIGGDGEVFVRPLGCSERTGGPSLVYENQFVLSVGDP